jgi:septal ring factor EnvC (AmiA/AmiB activator)
MAVIPLPGHMPRAQEAASPAGTPSDTASDLAAQKKATREELDAIAKSISLSNEHVEVLKKSIEDLQANSADIREALVASASKRKKLERQIADGEKKLEYMPPCMIAADCWRRSWRHSSAWAAIHRLPCW